SRLATSTSTRSAKGSLPAFCTRFVFDAKPSRMFSRPSSRHSQRATSIGPQQAAKSRFNALGGRTAFSSLSAAQKLNQTLKMRRKEVFASQIGDDALFGMAVLPVSLHQADVFELHPLGTFGFDRA